MKKSFVILEGVSDLPCDELEGRTPLQVARSVHLSRWATDGASGLIEPVRESQHSRGEVLLGLLFGLKREDALALHRAPLEAASYELEMKDYSAAYCGRFVTLNDGAVADLPSDISVEETAQLAKDIQASWEPGDVLIHAVGPGRVIVLCREEEPAAYGGRPPCFMKGEQLRDFVAVADSRKAFSSIHRLAGDVLEGHGINQVRVDLGQNPANGFILWGGGSLKPVTSPAAIQSKGAIVSGCPMARGFAKVFGLGWTGLRSAAEDGEKPGPAFRIAELVEQGAQSDKLVLYCQASGEVGDHGSPQQKVRAIDRIDQLVLRPFSEYLAAQKPYRLAILSEGLVASAERLPAAGSLPVVIVGEGVEPDVTKRFEEAAAAQGRLGLMKPEQVFKKINEE